MFTIESFYKLTKHNAIYSIMPLENIPSVIEYGILSFDRAKQIEHSSLALESVQQKREYKVTSAKKSLHFYANLYFDAHNPMLSRLRHYNDKICILAVRPEILNLPNVVVTDRNAATTIAKYVDPENMSENLDFDRIYKKYWYDTEEAETNPYVRAENKAIKCAEILVPEVVPYDYIIGAIVQNIRVKEQLVTLGFNKRIIVDEKRFF